MISKPKYRELPESLSIVIPAYNEAERILETLETLDAWSRANSFEFLEILVVNDGSKDNTSQVVSSAIAGKSQFRLIENPGNRGKGFAIKNGMSQAKGEWRLFSDADLSAPITELPKLWAAVQEQNADVAIGSRALNRKLIKVHQSRFREVGGIVFNRVMRVLTGLPFADTQCGFKLFSAKFAQAAFSRITVDGFGFDAEALFIAKHHGAKIVEVPVLWSHVEGTKMRLGSDSLTMVMDLIRTRQNQIAGLYK
jgi:dolichyl-phosphate beta-glucosyltransferase